MDDTHGNTGDFWLDHARRCARKVNAAWWLNIFAPILIFYSISAFCAIYYLRANHFEITLANLWPFVLALLIGGAAFGYFLSRKKFIDVNQALVRLESKLRLNNRLSSAAKGIGSWPGAPAKVEDGIEWKWQWIYSPALILVACLSLALMLPVPAKDDALLGERTLPSAIEQMEKNLEALEKEDVLEEEELEKLQQQIDELKGKPFEEWYSHSNMEAMDHMRKSFQQSMRDMGQDFEEAERSLNALENFSDELTQEAKEKLMSDFQEAVKGLENAGLQPKESLMDALKGIDPSKLKQSMSGEQLDKLKEALKKNAGACKECSGGKGSGALSEDERELMDLINGTGKGSGKGSGPKGGEGIGKGGINRGPGAAPLSLADEESNVHNKLLEGVSNEDLTRAGIGDAFGESQGEHEIEEIKVGPREAGGVKSTGKGGEAVWRESLLPDEQEVLKKYFR